MPQRKTDMWLLSGECFVDAGNTRLDKGTETLCPLSHRVVVSTNIEKAVMKFDSRYICLILWYSEMLPSEEHSKLHTHKGKNSILRLRQFWDLLSHLSPPSEGKGCTEIPFSPDAPHCPCTTACIADEMHPWTAENVFLLQRATREDRSQPWMETRRWGRRNIKHPRRNIKHPWRGMCNSSTWVQVLTVLHTEM